MSHHDDTPSAVTADQDVSKNDPLAHFHRSLQHLGVQNTIESMVKMFTELRGLTSDGIAYREDGLKNSRTVTRSFSRDVQPGEVKSAEERFGLHIDTVKSYLQKYGHDKDFFSDLFDRERTLMQDKVVCSPHPQSLQERIKSSMAALKDAGEALKSGDSKGGITHLERSRTVMAGHWGILDPTPPTGPEDVTDDEEEEEAGDEDRDLTEQGRTTTSSLEGPTDSKGEEGPEEKTDSGRAGTAKDSTAPIQEEVGSHLAQLSI